MPNPNEVLEQANKLNAVASNIMGVSVKSDVKEAKKEDEDNELITVIKFETSTDPQVFVNLLRASRLGLPIEACFTIRQPELPMR